MPEKQPCHWWVDPVDGRRYFIPGCDGACIHGKRGCTCPAPARRRKINQGDSLADDYAKLAHEVDRLRQQNQQLRRERNEWREKFREIRDGCTCGENP